MPYPHNCWVLVEGTSYQNNPVYRYPATDDYCWEDREYLVCLPPAVVSRLRAGERGQF